MNSSTRFLASLSLYCTGGDFMKYELGASSAPPMPRSSASLAQRTASIALQPVEEVGVAAEVELVGALERDAAVAEQARQHAVDDRGADLGLDVVPDDRQVLVEEPLLPVRLARDEDGYAVDETDACG